jgi:hypothetical protein
MSSCWTMSPVCSSCGSWNRTNISTFRASDPTVRRSRIDLGSLTRLIHRSSWVEVRQPKLRTPAIQSALRELNPPVQVGSLGPLPLGQGHVISAEAVGLEPTTGHRLRTCFRDRLLIRPDDFRTLSAAAAGIEPASGRLTVAFPYQHGTHRIDQSAWSDLNRRSRAPEARGVPGFPTR